MPAKAGTSEKKIIYFAGSWNKLRKTGQEGRDYLSNDNIMGLYKFRHAGGGRYLGLARFILRGPELNSGRRSY
jgi:hypothetical protein